MNEFLAYEDRKRFGRMACAGRSGGLNLDELQRSFHLSGMYFDAATVRQIGRKYDKNNSAKIELDEFVQLVCDWEVYVSTYVTQSAVDPATYAARFRQPKGWRVGMTVKLKVKTKEEGEGEQEEEGEEEQEEEGEEEQEEEGEEEEEEEEEEETEEE